MDDIFNFNDFEKNLSSASTFCNEVEETSATAAAAITSQKNNNPPDNFFDIDILSLDICTASQRKESGYNTTSTINPIQQNNDNFIPYNYDNLNESRVNDFEKKLRNADMEKEAENFIQNPNKENIFSTNFEYFEHKIIQEENLPNFAQYIREALNHEFGSIICSRIVNETSSTESMIKDSTSNAANNVEVIENNNENENIERNTSPNLFEDLEEDESQHIIKRQKLDFALPEEITNGMQDIATERVVSELSRTQGNEESSKRKIDLILRIKDLIKNVLQNLVNEKPVEFHIRDTGKWSNCGLIDDTELYYRNPELVQNQVNAVSAVNDICCLLNASPWELGILSSSKGIIAGPLRITLADNEIINCSHYRHGFQIPKDTSGIKTLETNAKLVLVVEKDTVFERLLQLNILSVMKYDILLVTGKGFPDINTRVLLKKLWEQLKLPIYVLVDADPFGIEILLVYRYGSKNMSYNSDQLVCPKIHWIGIHPSEIELLAIPSMPLNREDKKKITSLLQRSYLNEDIKNEILALQRINRKSEIEGLLSFSLNFLTIDYIPNKIKRNFSI